MDHDNEEKTKEEILSQFENKDGKYIHKLTETIDFGSECITEFELDIPKVKHMRNIPTTPKLSDIIDVVGKLANQPKSVMDELSIVDMNILSEYFSAFG